MGCLLGFLQNKKKKINSESQLVNSQISCSQQEEVRQDQSLQRTLDSQIKKTDNIKQPNDQMQHKNDGQKQIKLSIHSSIERDIIKCWIEDCNKFNYDLIQNIKGQYENVLLFENIQFYYKEIKNNKQQKDVNLYEIEGFIYLTEYDQNFNPKYKLQSGIFLINLEQRKFELNGQGIEYQGKSKFEKYKGKFENGEYIPEQINKINNQNQNQNQQSNNSKIIIIDMATGKQMNTKNKNRKQQKQVQDTWCKYNQQISNNDMNILEKKDWITSSIIDSYVLKLNIKSENEYFKLTELERKETKRVLFLPTTLTTNLGNNFDKTKANNLLEQELLEYSQMNLEITKIYKKIGFPINKNNFHWYFLLFDAENGQVQIFDSTANSYDSKHNQHLINTLAAVLKIKINKTNIHEQSGQQRNGYSCGYHVCYFMKVCQEQQFHNNQIKYKYKEKEIVKILKDVIARD